MSSRPGGRRAIRTILAATMTALLLDALVLVLPTSAYQRWELAREFWYSHLPWVYERIHFDPTPIDIAIIGSSKAFYGIDPDRLEQKLRQKNDPAHVANLAKLGAGRNIDLTIVKEL